MKSSTGGPERYVLAFALLIPLVFGVLALTQAPGASLASPLTVLAMDTGPSVAGKRPIASNPGPPPTLVPPDPTPKPTPMAAGPSPTPTPKAERTYTVQPGDELKHIAADYKVSIWKIIAVNDIPNPDSLRVGQELHIPDN
jgi:LysM repeat protein